MKKLLCTVLLMLAMFQLRAADYYWVNGGGNWSDLNHWRLGSSAGPIPSIVPSSADNVFFDANSGFGTTTVTKTVTLDANGFCNNMSWASGVPNNPIFSTANTSFTVQVNGSVVLASTTTYNVILAFKGTTPATLTANGNVLGELGMEIDKPGSSLTLADNLIVPTTNVIGTNGLTFTSGTFDISGKNVTLYNFLSTNTNTRVLLMTNANLTLNAAFRYQSANKSVTATGSTLTAGGLLVDGGIYNRATVNQAGGPNTNIIDSATFHSLTFTSTSGIYSDIENNNNIDTLVFTGVGTVLSNNIIGTIIFNGQGSVVTNNTIGFIQYNAVGFLNTGNTVGKLTALDKLQILGTNTIDSLLLAPNKTTTLSGTINISKYMKAQGGSCQAFTEITSADSVRLMFGSAATALIDNVYLTNIKAYGNITPIAVSGVDGDNNTGFNITAPTSVAGTNLYWVGGTGDWNDNTHWSYTSGGAGGACIPFIADTVIFDSGSGLSGKTVSTTGNAYCYNMNWVTGTGNCTFAPSGSYSFSIYGSVSLNATVVINGILGFAGTGTTSTIATNGNTLGTPTFNVRKKTGGLVTLLDNWTNTNGVITLTGGSLNMANRTLSFNRFTGNTNNVRTLDISNASITVNNTWAYVGSNKSINSNGSYINAVYALNTDGLSYPKVDATYPNTGNPQAFSVSGTTFGMLTFTGTNTTSGVNIDSNNTIRRLEFKGAGAIAGPGNVIDTLILAGSRVYQVTGASTINKYLSAQSTACAGLLEIRGNTTGTFQFNPSAVTDMANVYLQNMTATGIPAVPVSGADAGGNSGWNISSTAGVPHYWIGGSGDWNDNAHWSTTSGGIGGACIPTVYDDVIFDAGSGFTAGSKTVTVNNGNAYARNIDWSAATNAPVWSKATAWTIEAWGDTVLLNPAATFTVSPLTFKGNTNTVISGTALGNFDIRMSKVGGSLTLLNDYSNILTDIYVNDGNLDLSGRTLSISGISNEGLSNAMSIDITNADITLDTSWTYNGTAAAHILTATGSTITTEVFNALGLAYNNVNVSGILNTSAILSNASVNALTFTNTNSASLVGINGTGNTIGTADYKGGGGIYGTGNTIDTLIFFPGSNYTLTAGTNTTVTGEWYGSGTPCHLTQIYSSSTTANATVTKTSGSVDFDYVRLRRITATGAAAPFEAREHTDNQGNNSNWTIATYNGAAPIYGLGPDTVVASLPYTIHTDGFFGSPSSQYLWNDGSALDSLVITDTGTYSVNVSFIDGCNINDQLRVTLINPLGLTLTGFNAQVQNCQSLLHWNVADVKGFSHFGVEKSNNGSTFSVVASVPYTSGVHEYAYTDKTISGGKTFYRLKLMDLDGTYEYSPVVSVYVDCDDHRIRVYPTTVTNVLHVELSEAYEHADIHIMNALGMPVDAAFQGTGLQRTVNLQDVPAAMYLLQVVNDGAIQSFRFVKQ